MGDTVGTKTLENPRLRLRCPSCGMELGDMPDFPASVPCDGCGFTITVRSPLLERLR